VSIVGLAGPATAGPDEGGFVAAINAARQAAGLAPLPIRSDLVASARNQAGRCAAAGELFHNPNLGGDISGWHVVGENVGVGPASDWGAISRAFLASPEHRANILDPDFDYVGVGTATDRQGRLWVSEVFISVAGVGSGGSNSGSLSGSSAAASLPDTQSPAVVAPALTPQQILRARLHDARRNASRHPGGDPVREAVGFADAMATLTG
jgi:hypothetical protein